MQSALRDDPLANPVRPASDSQDKTVESDDNSDLLIPDLDAQLREAQKKKDELLKKRKLFRVQRDAREIQRQLNADLQRATEVVSDADTVRTPRVSQKQNLYDILKKEQKNDDIRPASGRDLKLKDLPEYNGKSVLEYIDFF